MVFMWKSYGSRSFAFCMHKFITNFMIRNGTYSQESFEEDVDRMAKTYR